MKLFAIALVGLLGLAAANEAFVSSPNALLSGMKSRAASRSQLNMQTTAFDNEPGVLPPLGYFDPLGIFKDKTPDDPEYKRWRAVEIKHGRGAMLAVLGYIVPYFYKFPGLLSSSQNLKFADVPAGIDALKVVPIAGIVQILLFQSFLETVLFKKQFEPDCPPGDYQPDWWYRESDPAKLRDLQDKEINNGRLAQMAILGLVVGDLVSDKPFPFLSK